LRNAGLYAANLFATNSGFSHCLIENTGSTAIVMDSGNRRNLTPGNAYVEDCEISRFGRIAYTFKPAVNVVGCGNSVRHCLIYDSPSHAILYSGNEHTLEMNEIHDVCQNSSDVGTLNTFGDWGSRGNIVRHNFIHSISTHIDGYGVHGVYLDGCDSGDTVFGNIFMNIETRGVMHSGGRDNLILNNLFVECHEAFFSDNRGVDWVSSEPWSDANLLKRLHLAFIDWQAEPWLSAYPGLALLPDDYSLIFGTHWLWPEGVRFDRNAGWNNGSWMRESNWGEPTDLVFGAFASIADNNENQQPLFGQEVIANRSTRPDQVTADVPGFEPIPFARIGPRKSAYGEWKVNQGVADDREDPDDDGLPAIAEYFFGTRTTVADGWLKPVVVDEVLNVNLPQEAGMEGVFLVWEKSSDLVSWQATELPVRMNEDVQLFLRPKFVRIDR
jgi:hypothetical protein